jgi:hypothetical protein
MCDLRHLNDHLARHSDTSQIHEVAQFRERLPLISDGDEHLELYECRGVKHPDWLVVSLQQ